MTLTTDAAKLALPTRPLAAEGSCLLGKDLRLGWERTLPLRKHGKAGAGDAIRCCIPQRRFTNRLGSLLYLNN